MSSGPNKALAFAPTALRPLHYFSIGSRLRFQVQQSFAQYSGMRVPSGRYILPVTSYFAAFGLGREIKWAKFNAEIRDPLTSLH